MRFLLGSAVLAWATMASGTEEHGPRACMATAALEYFQRGAEADAEITVDNPECAVASGSFIVEVMIRADGSNESEKLTFEETWSRDDGRAVVLQRRYAIGDNVQLLRIRVRNLTCSCNEETNVD